MRAVEECLDSRVRGNHNTGTNNNTGIITDANGVQRGQIGYGAPYGENTMFQNVAVANVTQGQPPYLQRQNPVSPTGGASGVSGLAVQPGAAAAPYTTATMPPQGMPGLGLTLFSKPVSYTTTGTNAPTGTMPPPQGMTGGLGLTTFSKPVSDTTTGTNTTTGNITPPQGMPGGLGLTPFLKPVSDTASGADQPPATTVPTWPAIPGSASGGTSGIQNAPGTRAGQAQPDNTYPLDMMNFRDTDTNMPLLPQPDAESQSTPQHKPSLPYPNQPESSLGKTAIGNVQQASLDIGSAAGGAVEYLNNVANTLNLPNLIYHGFTGQDIPSLYKYAAGLGRDLTQWATNNPNKIPLNVEPGSVKSYVGDTIRGLTEAAPAVLAGPAGLPAAAAYFAGLAGGNNYADYHNPLSAPLYATAALLPFGLNSLANTGIDKLTTNPNLTLNDAIKQTRDEIVAGSPLALFPGIFKHSPHGGEPKAPGEGNFSEGKVGQNTENIKQEGGTEASKQLTPYDIPEVVRAREVSNAKSSTHDIDTPERQTIRGKLTDELYGNGALKKERDAYIVMGPPASGKSTISEPLAQKTGSLIIDSDMAKMRLPEYDNGLGAQATHIESTMIADKVRNRAFKNGDNVVLPVVGKSIGNIRWLRDELNNQGYNVHLILVDLSPDKAARRAIRRFMDTGRFVDPDYVYNKVGSKPAENYDILKKEGGFKSYEKYSNDVEKGQQPKLIEIHHGR